MARVDVLMPQMGESIAEGTLSKWLKKLGDEVKRDEPLFEISTDKVDAEIPAPTAGVLAEIKVQEGQTVPVQTLVAVIETDKAAAVAGAPATAAAPAAPPVAAAQRAPAAPGGTAVSPPPTTVPVPRPIHRPRGPSARGALAGRPGRAVFQDPQDHRRPHDHVAPDVGARDELLRGRLQPGRGAAAQTQGVLRRARRQSHVPRVYRQGVRRAAARASRG